MPTSTYAQIPAVVHYLHLLRPMSVLDVGLGNGKMGFIARDLLDVMLGERYLRADWKVRIDGIEIFERYVQAHQRAIYDDIHIGDAFDVIDRLGTYDLIIIGDVLEHFDRVRAEAFLEKAVAHSAGAIILNIPLGERWTQDNIYDNEYERHRSFWRPEEFQAFAEQSALSEFPGLGPYGSFLIRPAAYRHYRARVNADRLMADGSPDAAMRLLIGVAGGLPPDIATELQIAELLVRQGLNEQACERLERARPHFPNHASLGRFIAQLKPSAAA